MNFLFLAPEFVVIFLEQGGKIVSLEQELETVKAAVGQGMEALAQSLEERRTLKGKLD